MMCGNQSTKLPSKQNTKENIMNELMIAEINIQQSKGLYCLNDLHRACGREERHKPANFTRSQQTIDLIKELEIAQIRAIQQKQGLGTFVCKELVYAYAMWVSPKFHLTVIRAFDSLANQKIDTDKELTKIQAEIFSMVLQEFGDKISPQAREALLLAGSEKFLGISTGYRPPVAQQTYSASEIGERLGISGNKVGRLTKAHNLKTEEYGIWVLDQSAHSNKQVTSFRYYESVVPVLKALIQTAL